MATSDPEHSFALYRCEVCGAYWRLFPDSWSLWPGQVCGQCCDNVPMDRVRPIHEWPTLAPGEQSSRIEDRPSGVPPEDGWPPLAEIREVVESDEDSAKMLTGFGRACLRKVLRLLDSRATTEVERQVRDELTMLTIDLTEHERDVIAARVAARLSGATKEEAR